MAAMFGNRVQEAIAFDAIFLLQLGSYRENLDPDNR